MSYNFYGFTPYSNNICMEIGIELVLYVHTYVYLVSNVVHIEKVGKRGSRKKLHTKNSIRKDFPSFFVAVTVS